ncbi:peptide-methionine (S)-S-oxide reductase MsrA [Hydromonas duriensis]|uniref:Peptide methionine sulfoxide reductase MsrA n=1 Tax=Hydromonas duriensis TaxID=1527608 RepID=A0A4R6YB32_9BURK|nr:peptide-methionine (S)-S-oxide reductase MsrA [Hydromonas duriensis]TDR32768.1 peptide-methionine (S)-S-oxide reductase [Hydromonas duriensis]
MSIAHPITTQYHHAPQFERATLGGGCFWCIEAVFTSLKGVIDVESGYAGSDYPHANYQAVCTGKTGLAEVVQILFDPSIISYEQLLAVFFTVHNPTTLNQQGADKGTQYRSVIFTHSAEQAAMARAAVSHAQQDWDAPIVTQIETFNHYTRAEDEHQEYFAQHPFQGYCQATIPPKLAKLRAQYNSLLK